MFKYTALALLGFAVTTVAAISTPAPECETLQPPVYAPAPVDAPPVYVAPTPTPAPVCDTHNELPTPEYAPAPVYVAPAPTPAPECETHYEPQTPVYPNPPAYIAPGPTPAYTPPAPASENNCQALCDATETCRNDPHAHGSYCKSYQDKAVCFGLYELPYGGLCFQPNDPTCDDSKLQPVACGHDETCTTDGDCPAEGSYCMNDPTKTAPYVCHVPNHN